MVSLVVKLGSISVDRLSILAPGESSDPRFSLFEALLDVILN